MSKIEETFARVLDGDEVSGVLSGAFYTRGLESESAPPESSVVRKSDKRTGKGAAVEKPSHYKVICISMYTGDLERMDSMVDELKGRGLTKASRSALIRAALEQVDLEKISKGM